MRKFILVTVLAAGVAAPAFAGVSFPPGSGGGMLYPGSGIANSTGSSWGTSYGVSGSGNVALTASPTFTGTITGANANWSGSVGIGTTSPADMLDVNAGNLGLLQPAASTSGTQQVASPKIILNSTAWTGSASATGQLALNYTLSQPNTVGAGGVLNFSMPVASGISASQANTQVLFNSPNTSISVENTNDSEAAVFGETYNAALFGIRNFSGGTLGVIPAGQAYAFLGMGQSGIVGTLQQQNFTNTTAPSYRNVLDDGTASARVGLGTTSPLAKLDVRGLIAANGVISNGATFTIASGCGTATNLTGGATTGSFKAGQSACAPVITLPAAPNGWVCQAWDITTNADTLKMTADTPTSCTLSGTVAASDVIVFNAQAF